MAKETKINNKKEKNSKDKTSFFKSFKAELKRVSWPTPKQLVNNTTAVIVIVLITAAIVFVLDLTFETINKYGVEKVKAIITSNSSEKNTANTEETAESKENDAENPEGEENSEETNTVTEEATTEKTENTVEQ